MTSRVPHGRVRARKSCIDAQTVHNEGLRVRATSRRHRAAVGTRVFDIVVLAPAALLDAPIAWRPTGALRTEATFTSHGQSVTAALVFDERGDLATFRSEDRFESAGGVSYQKRGWSTPVSDYRWFAGLRLPAHGEAVRDEPEGELVYARLDLESLETILGCP